MREQPMARSVADMMRKHPSLTETRIICPAWAQHSVLPPKADRRPH